MRSLNESCLACWLFRAAQTDGEKAKQLFLLLWWQQLRGSLYFGKSAHERNLAYKGRRPEAVSEGDSTQPSNSFIRLNNCEGSIGLVMWALKPDRNERPRSSYSV